MKSLDSETRTAIQEELRGNKEVGEDELTKSYLNRIKSSVRDLIFSSWK